MKKQIGIIVYAASMILKASRLATAWAGKSRRRGLELVAKMPIDEKDKEIVFLHDPIYQLETWVNILRKSGLDDEGMTNWHKEFERNAPEAHQDFLEGLGLPVEEIQNIRKWSGE